MSHLNVPTLPGAAAADADATAGEATDDVVSADGATADVTATAHHDLS